MISTRDSDASPWFDDDDGSVDLNKDSYNLGSLVSAHHVLI